MARRSAKAGPARSRRRPDPSARWQPGIVVYPLFADEINPGAGSLEVTLGILSTPTGNNVLEDTMVATGEPTNIVFRDNTGVFYSPDSFVLNDGQTITLNWASGLPAGTGAVIAAFGDQAVRGVKGEFVGTLVAQAAIT